jgi:three-Cys-motif partner protein
MPRVDHHSKPFSEGTITKLKIFEEYLRAWLPVFICGGYKHANICDFFAGIGYDIQNIPGSPIRILKIIKEYQALIIERNFKITVVLNEYKKEKFRSLQENVKNYINDNLASLTGKNLLDIQLYNQDFQKIFFDIEKDIKNVPNLIFLDQSGIKQVTSKVFSSLDQHKCTDFMFFIASSYFRRFGDSESFLRHFSCLDMPELSKINTKDRHKAICDFYKKQLPAHSSTKIYPFTLRKSPNIYGLVFGSKHVLGVDKFLHIAWQKDKIGGEANFDINNDAEARQGLLFGPQKKSKLEIFNDDLKTLILALDSISNKEIYDFTLQSGHIPEHATQVVRNMKKDGQVQYSGHVKINYDSCYKKKNIVIFKNVNKNEKIKN